MSDAGGAPHAMEFFPPTRLFLYTMAAIEQ
jgi:hypothetical protein